MGTGRTYLAAFAGLHAQGDAEERKRVARQGLAMLAQIAEREPAPLEGIAADQLLLAVRTALADGVLGDLDWLAPAGAAIALFELAQALPASTERRELGRRVLTRLREADRDTFVRLLIAFARSSPKVVASEGLRARLEVVLSSPLTAPGAIGELALGLLAQPSLAQSWVEQPATGSLPARRLAARILAHGAREAVRRLDGGDRGGIQVLARPGVRGALVRLLRDREALVWRFAGIARGILAHVDPELADDIDRELRPAENTALRRASASAAAALERGGAATRWTPMLIEHAAKQPGVARGTILGLAGLATTSPQAADELATALAQHAPLETAEALADLRREEAAQLLPQATGAVLRWTREQLRRDPGNGDDGRFALIHALEAELGHGPRPDGVGVPIAAARAALDAGDAATALREAKTAVDEIAAAADWLERASDDDAVDRRHSVRLLRELDRELLADNALPAVLALAHEGDPMRAQFSAALATIEHALLQREVKPEAAQVAHGELRIARLRALVRLLDGVRAPDTGGGDADLAPRLAAVRQLMVRAQADHSPLRRAVWAAMTRAGDALLRDGHAELTDLLLAWTMLFPEEDFAIVREASMVPEIEAAFAAYARLHQATWAAADPNDTDAVRGVVERLGELADALPPEQSPRVESVRLSLARLGNLLARVIAAGGRSAIPRGTLDAVATELGALARRVYGAQQRLGVASDDRSHELESIARTLEPMRSSRASTSPVLLGPDAKGRPSSAESGAFRALRPDQQQSRVEEAVAGTSDMARHTLPSAIATAVERVLAWLAHRPQTDGDEVPTTQIEVVLPGWVPLSRLLGSFYVIRPIGRGAAGSVLLAVRSDERTRANRELVALKVPDYSGGGARNLSEQEFERLFREEAGALLTLPAHANIARFITFDASAQPKPILVMEFVRGANLERTLEGGDLDTERALAIIDDVLAGLVAMHEVQIAHLDVKPANVVLREGTGEGVLVDFGLAGRHVRAGCGSVHYGAAEVWSDTTVDADPFAADVYAAACVAYEVLTNRVLFAGESIKEVMFQHFSKQPASEALARIERARRLAPLAELLRAALSRDAKRRPTAARLRAGFAAVAPELRQLEWPLSA